MRAIIVTSAALLLAGAAQAQTPPGQSPGQAEPGPPTSSLTRDLNSGPPVPAGYLAPAPASVAEPAPATPPATVEPEPRPTLRPAPAPPAVAPSAVPATRPSATRPAPADARALQAALVPDAPTTSPRVLPITSPPLTSPMPTSPMPTVPAVEATQEAAAPPPPPAAPSLTVLDSAARAALPFIADLPPGFEIVTGRPGPDFRIYTIRRGDRSFVMVYAGPASQFPIYSGQMVEAGGRASIVATENGVRRAVEHLFQRSTAPGEVHIWTMSLDGADRALAEQIAQTIDVR